MFNCYGRKDDSVCETELNESKLEAYDKCVGFPGDPELRQDEPQVVEPGDKTEDLNQNLDCEPFLGPGEGVEEETNLSWQGTLARCLPREYKIGKRLDCYPLQPESGIIQFIR